jgi:hypothetical protein
MYASAQYINTVSINQKLVCTIQLQALLVCPPSPLRHFIPYFLSYSPDLDSVSSNRLKTRHNVVTGPHLTLGSLRNVFILRLAVATWDSSELRDLSQRRLALLSAEGLPHQATSCLYHLVYIIVAIRYIYLSLGGCRPVVFIPPCKILLVGFKYVVYSKISTLREINM